jgi:two-component system, NarL family, response regulator
MGAKALAVAVVPSTDLFLLELISHGASDEAIGEELRVSVETVRASIHGIVLELGARNREHAVAIALKTGLIN